MYQLASWHAQLTVDFENGHGTCPYPAPGRKTKTPDPFVSLEQEITSDRTHQVICQ